MIESGRAILKRQVEPQKSDVSSGLQKGKTVLQLELCWVHFTKKAKYEKCRNE